MCYSSPSITVVYSSSKCGLFISLPPSLSSHTRYPWLEAVHRYRVSFKWVFEWDYARMVIPARKGSGLYLVHMVWRGYRDVLDIDVLPAPSVNLYGAGSNEVTYTRTDHCQYKNKQIHGKDYNYQVYSVGWNPN